MKIRFNILALAQIVAITLVVVIMLPAVVKSLHLFNHNKHKVCNGSYQLHFHNKDLDCDFYKFNLNKVYSYTSFSLKTSVLNPVDFKPIFRNLLIKENFIGKAFLRGPPVLV